MRVWMHSALMALLPLPALAQDVVGSAVVGGKIVTLFSDNTWEFVFNPKPGCDQLTKDISFCPATAKWKRTRDTGPEITATYYYDDATFLMFIVENQGINAGYSWEFMRTAILENAAAGSGYAVEDIPVLGAFEAELDQEPAETLVYGIDIDGVQMVFANTFNVGADLTVQVITYKLGTEYSETFKTLAENVNAGVKIDKMAQAN